MPKTANIHGTGGDNLTVVLPEDIRSGLIALRVKHGANTPIGHRCSNLVGQLENYELADPDTRRVLDKRIMRSMAELAELTSNQ